MNFLFALAFIAGTVRADPSTQPADGSLESIDRIIGTKSELRGEVQTFVLPRTDLNVVTDAATIPVEAGMESRFYFFPCPCGKMNVAGEFVVADYEMNDVIDELRKTFIIKIVGTTPMFFGDHPRVMSVRFQGEGDAVALATLIRNAINWTGDNRNRPATQPSAP